MKAHFASPDEPIHEGDSVIAACGSLVMNIEILTSWKSSFRLGQKIKELIAEEGWGSVGNCHKCLSAELGGSYVYGIRTRSKSEEEAG